MSVAVAVTEALPGALVGSRPNPKHAALYLRISLDHAGDGLAVERQRDLAEKLAAQRGWTIVGEYVDNSVSASKVNVVRPAYRRLLSDYEANRFSAIICYDLDRFTRQPRELEDWIDAAERRGLALVTLNGEADLTTDGGRMYARIKAAVAKGEVERKGQRQHDANVQRANRGGVPKGTKALGYTSGGDVVPDEALVVRALFEGFAKGETLRSLSREYGITPSTIRGILLNARYAGRRVYMRRVKPASGAVGGSGAPSYVREVVGMGNWEPIISGDLFDLVNARLSDPRRKTNTTGSTARKHLGSGLFMCECQMEPVDGLPGHFRPIAGAKAVVGGGDGSRYRCRVCGLVRSRAAVDDYVQAVLVERLSQPDALAELAPQPQDVAALRTEGQALEARRKAVVGMLADGLLSEDDARDALESVRSRLAEVHEIIGRSAMPPVLDGLEGRLAAEWGELSADRRRAIIGQFMTVTLHRARRGAKSFDPSSVTIDWTPTRL